MDGVSRKSAVVAVAGLALLTTGLTGCSFGAAEDDYAAVCIDETTQQRVDDGRCRDVNGTSFVAPFLWYYIGRNASRLPAVGERVMGGTMTRPTTGRIGLGYAREGGAITKGGFGSRAKSGSGGGLGGGSGGNRGGGGRSGGS